MRSRASNWPPQRARGRPLRRLPARNICAKESATNAKRPLPAVTICSAAPASGPRTEAAARPPSASPRRDPPPGRARDRARREHGASLGRRAPGKGTALKRGPWKSRGAGPGPFRLCWSFRFVFWTRPALAFRKSGNS
uniref:Uncharacterized protein n=1 Tax=Rangifer tarandus platyrhynchus TaxID=3082113 RepID=A0ACB0DVA0_RANTA|nr:unnamed protein product [Rangifer tarandus platyrhynchus]